MDEEIEGLNHSMMVGERVTGNRVKCVTRRFLIQAIQIQIKSLSGPGRERPGMH